MTQDPVDGRQPALAACRTPLWSLVEVRWAALATALFAVGAVFQLTGGPAWSWWTLYLACYAAGGWEPGLAGLRALRAGTLDVDLLMVVAAIGAAGVGQVFDGALLIVIFATSGALEAYATRRTADSVRRLLDLAPPYATRVTADGEDRVDTVTLAVGDVILVRPGERIGADGTVVDGVSDVDQATITGEPLPAVKAVGDEVYAGTINGTGALRVRVDRPAADSVVARIVAMVREASATKAPTQLFIEKVEQRYSVGVVVATLALFAIPLAFGEGFTDALLRAMTFMIVASPCAVVLATMPPLLAAIATAGRHGVLVKSAVAMERLAETTLVAVDKTGTLTVGTPRLAAVRLLPGGPVQDTDRLLALAAAAERPSEHPLAAAIVAAARAAGLTIPTATHFVSAPGHGISARVDGHHVTVSRASTVAGETDPHHDGHTTVVVTVDGHPAGILGLTDTVRPEAADAVERLTALIGQPPMVLTGDNMSAAARVAAEAGIREVHADLLPQEKVAVVRQRQELGERLLVVGDGVNDAPALAAAHAGIAMGGAGSDLALQTADVVLVRDDLTAIPAVIALSRRARRYVAANLAIAATFIAVLATWDIVGHLPLPLGVAGHEGSTVIVALNGLRLLRSAAWRAH
ncbi:heavy metal translocating P-type ATPase [Phytohabitans kaempferiae]|uniref:Heavy metal translocating P-type ATPase n=1 Tax=Phytohabitans kaempferiae TaxID=1620943 RepID=A0ABV6M8Z2_9ACTN